MSAEAFACILLLRKSSERARILSVLGAERRAAIEQALDGLKNTPPEYVEERLRQMRNEEQSARLGHAEARAGRELSHASPKLIAWLSRPF